MFIKNLFYKITNPEKYNEHKINLAVKKKIKWYNGLGIGWYIFYFSEEAEIA